MSDDGPRCVLCDNSANVSQVPGYAQLRVASPRCGQYRITSSLYGWFRGPSSDNALSPSQQRDRALLPFLSAHTKQMSAQSAEAYIEDDNWRALAEAHRGTTVSTKLRRILGYMGERSTHLGSIVDMVPNDFLLFDVIETNEMDHLLAALSRQGLIGAASSSHCVQLTVEGWDRLEQGEGGHGVGGRCFVAMSFDRSLMPIWQDGMYAALKLDCGLDPIRIDQIPHNEKICDRLLAEIRSSQFLVADFTQHRGGVYFEAGFAMGLGRPVIWTCRKDDLQNAHFDTRQFNHICWSEAADLREQLRDRVRATILKERSLQGS